MVRFAGNLQTVCEFATVCCLAACDDAPMTLHDLSAEVRVLPTETSPARTLISETAEEAATSN